MKKIYFAILSTILFVQVTNAQLTLTKAAYEPVVGDLEYRKGFDSVSTLVNSAGANQTWNFTSLVSNTTAAATSSYILPSSAPGYTSSYASATVAKTTGTVSDFFKATATQFELIGMVPSSSVSLNFTNSAIAAIWPVTNTFSLTDVVSGTIKTNILFPSTGPFNGTSKTLANGTGTLQLPGSITLNDCMQLKTTLNGTATVNIFTISISVTLTNVSYDYYHASQKFPVLSVSYNQTTMKQGASSPTITNTSAISINYLAFVGLTESTINSNLSLYPNPTNGKLNVALSNNKAENVTVKIINSFGQTVKSISLGNMVDINNQIDLSDLSNGVYFVKTTIGNSTSTKKLIKD